MRKLDEYYNLVRTHEPPLADDVLRAAVRTAVERVNAEIATEASSHSIGEMASNNAATSISELVASEAGFTLASMGGLTPILGGLALVGMLVVGVVLWRGQQESTSLIQQSSGSAQTLGSDKVIQGQNTTNTPQNTITPEQSDAIGQKNEESSKSASTQGSSVQSSSRVPIYDNTEELNPPPTEPLPKNESKQDHVFDVEMNEQERHKDSVSVLNQQALKKRDATRQRRHDLFLLLVQRAREHVADAHYRTYKGISCSLPAAMKGDASFDCILQMLEQQSVLLHDVGLTTLVQQARKEHTVPALNTLETYIKEHY
jgi:hypothetical protein